MRINTTILRCSRTGTIEASTYEVVAVVLMDASEVDLPESDVECASAVDESDEDCGAVDVGGLVAEPAEDIEREEELTMAVVESVRVRESDEGDSVSERVRESEEAEVEGARVVEAVLELDTGERIGMVQHAASKRGWVLAENG